MSSTDHAHLIRSCTYSADWLPQTPRFKDSVLEAMAEAGQGKTPTRSFYAPGHQDALYGRKSVGAQPYGEDCTDREMPRWVLWIRAAINHQFDDAVNHATLTKYATGATDYSPPRRDKDGGAFYVVSICDPSAPRTFRLLAERPKVPGAKKRAAPGDDGRPATKAGGHDSVWQTPLENYSLLRVSHEASEALSHDVPPDHLRPRGSAPHFTLVFRSVTKTVPLIPDEDFDAYVAVAREIGLLGKSNLRHCADVIAFIEFAREFTGHPVLCVLAHNLHQPTDMALLAEYMRRNRGQEEDRATLLAAAEHVRANGVGKTAKNGLLVRLVANVLGVEPLLEACRWLASDAAFAKLQEAARLLAGMDGADSDTWEATLNRIQSLLPKAGKYVTRHLFRSWCVAFYVHVPLHWRGFDHMSDGVAKLLTSMHKRGWPRWRMRRELGCEDELDITLVACEVEALVSEARKGGRSLAGLLAWLKEVSGSEAERKRVLEAVCGMWEGSTAECRFFGAADVYRKWYTPQLVGSGGGGGGGKEQEEGDGGDGDDDEDGAFF